MECDMVQWLDSGNTMINTVYLRIIVTSFCCDFILFFTYQIKRKELQFQGKNDAAEITSSCPYWRCSDVYHYSLQIDFCNVISLF